MPVLVPTPNSCVADARRSEHDPRQLPLVRLRRRPTRQRQVRILRQHHRHARTRDMAGIGRPRIVVRQPARRHRGRDRGGGTVTLTAISTYSTIVADPPWHVMGGPPWGGGRSKPLPYPTMHVDEIAALPVRELAATNAHLYLWTINAYIEDTYHIARAWGFKPSTLLTWAKPVTGGGAWWLLSNQHRARAVLSARCSPRRRADRNDVVRVAATVTALAEARCLHGHGRAGIARPLPRDVQPTRSSRMGHVGQRELARRGG